MAARSAVRPVYARQVKKDTEKLAKVMQARINKEIKKKLTAKKSKSTTVAMDTNMTAQEAALDMWEEGMSVAWC